MPVRASAYLHIYTPAYSSIRGSAQSSARSSAQSFTKAPHHTLPKILNLVFKLSWSFKLELEIEALNKRLIKRKLGQNFCWYPNDSHIIVTIHTVYTVYTVYIVYT